MLGGPAELARRVAWAAHLVHGIPHRPREPVEESARGRRDVDTSDNQAESKGHEPRACAEGETQDDTAEQGKHARNDNARCVRELVANLYALSFIQESNLASINREQEVPSGERKQTKQPGPLEPETVIRLPDFAGALLAQSRRHHLRQETQIRDPATSKRDLKHGGDSIRNEMHVESLVNAGLPNGSRLSCGRNARERKEAEAQRKRLAGEATQFFLTGERPSASSAC